MDAGFGLMFPGQRSFVSLFGLVAERFASTKFDLFKGAICTEHQMAKDVM